MPTDPSHTPSILSGKTLRKLEQLELVTIKRTKSSLKGERLSNSRGQSVEFADYRNYSPGDDLRYLDWNLFGRLDKLFVKLYEEEREFPVKIILDSSESMGFGEPKKFDYAKSLCAALGYLTLANFDRLQVEIFPPENCPQKTHNQIKNLRGKGHGLAFLRSLQNINFGGNGSLDSCINRIASTRGPKGAVFILSDFMEPPAFLESLKKLAGVGHSLILIHILSPQETHPDFKGDLKLVDSESGAAQEVSFGKARMKAYQKMLSGFCAQISEAAQKTGSEYIRCQSDQDLDKFLFYKLRQAGVIG